MTWEIKQYGQEALLINFEQRVSPEINAQVIAASNYLNRELGALFTFSIPAYCSLTIGFDQRKTNFEALHEKINSILAREDIDITPEQGETIRIPVCYSHEFAPDIERIMRHTGLSFNEVIEEHTNRDYRVYMLGYITGFGYLGEIPEILSCPRLDNPRTEVHRGSVGIAGTQTGIYPISAPGGWNIIGRTPVDIINAEKSPPFLLSPGDHVSFYAISKTEFAQFNA